MKIGAVILAGGEGRRIGGNKPLQDLAGRSLFEHVLDKVRGWDLPCAVAVRQAGKAGFAYGLPLLPDEKGAGPIAGIASALRHCRKEGWDAVLTLPCDTPLLPCDLPERLGAALDPARAAIARSAERLHPSCSLWRGECAAAVADYLRTGSSLMGFARAVEAAIVDWPVEPHDPFLNVNDASDLSQAERILRSP